MALRIGPIMRAIAREIVAVDKSIIGDGGDGGGRLNGVGWLNDVVDATSHYALHTIEM